MTTVASNSATPAIRLRSLAKSYGSVKALDGVDLTVARGAIYGFLGPNGAGKTTAIRCLLDLIRPNGGEVSVLGLDPRVNAVEIRQRTGYLPGELNFEDSLTAREALAWFDRFRDGAADWQFVAELADRLQLDLARPIRNLSKGNKQKLGVVQALMHRPELLLLDEPTSGLDPLMQREVVAIVRAARDAGATVFFSTHILSEARDISEQLAMIRDGRIIEAGPAADIIRYDFLRAEITLARPVSLESLGKLGGIEVLEDSTGTQLRLQITGPMAPLIDLLATHGVEHLETERPSLEQMFMKHYDSRAGGEDS